MTTDVSMAWEEHEKAQKDAFIAECKDLRERAKQVRLREYESITPASGYDVFEYKLRGVYGTLRVMDVPAEKLIAMYKSGMLNKNIPIKKYVENNVLGLENDAKVAQRFVPCQKQSYEGDSADQKLKEIAKDPRPHKKPVRKYLCEKCGLYHLTSSPK